VNREIVISTGGFSSRRRMAATTNPIASPTATPPIALSTNWRPAIHKEKEPDSTAPRAKR